MDLLEVKNLRVGFTSKPSSPAEASPVAWAVDGISFTIKPGQSFCLAGESGCGKSVSSLAIMGLLNKNTGLHLSGQVSFEDRDLLKLPRSEMDLLRGHSIGMIFQEPMTSLNPVMRVGDQVAEPLCLHKGVSRRAALDEAVRMLEKVGIRHAKQRAADYPHQLSGGMRQRVMIAMAMICSPKLLIADEPTTALDVTLQSQILDLMRLMQEESGAALLMITHDFDVVARSASFISIMYSGKIVESGPVDLLLKNPAHPYTKGLLEARPRFDPKGRHLRLKAIPGTVPTPLNRPPGCAFSNRCSQTFSRCREEMPPLISLGSSSADQQRQCRCWLGH